MTTLSHEIRTPDGITYKRGQAVEKIGNWYELGTHRTLIRVVIADHKYVVLPEDLEERE